jgi:branched-chain amino acid transport system ATP-binding protein
MMLEVQDLSLGYGGDPVLQGVSLGLEKGEIVTLVGANGAGKSTLVQGISGLMQPLAGRVMLDGASLNGTDPAERLRRGIAHVPEGRQIFAGMTVLENLQLGAYLEGGANRLDEVCGLFPVLRERLHDVAGNFSGGQQQMLAIARGLMSGPRIVLLDEPSLGLSPLLVGQVFKLVQLLRARGLTILLSEQNARAALAIADRGYVIENGRMTLSGPGRELLASPEIAERYLGVGTAHRATDAENRLAAELRECIGAPG